jgi:two-component system LytT family response regulator
MRVVIVDDERLARVRLKQLLAAHSEVDLVGEADTVDAARATIDRTKPDVVFLDVEMREGTGFDVIASSSVVFHAVFVTAFSYYAVRAFDVRATDYLLKPVSAERLAAALDRFVDRSTRASASLGLDDHVCLVHDRRPRFIRVRNIVTITAAGPYTEVRTTDDGMVFVHRSTHSWQERLPGTVFRRIHRSAIVNIDHVIDTEPLSTGGYRLRMRTGPSVLVSRRYAARLRRDATQPWLCRTTDRTDRRSRG